MPRTLLGPFCYLRAGTVLEDSAKAGTFVELKNTPVGEGAKVPHLLHMSRTRIGRDVRVAVDTMADAPVTVGDAWTASALVVADRVPGSAPVGLRARQVVKEGRGGRRDD